RRALQSWCRKRRACAASRSLPAARQRIKRRKPCGSGGPALPWRLWPVTVQCFCRLAGSRGPSTRSVRCPIRFSRMPSAQRPQSRYQSSTAVLALAALGVVFGDIGTSPLYTLKTVLSLAGDKVDPPTTLGVLSLIVWTLIVITSVKYVSIAMRVDNDGEGGILALMSLLGVRWTARRAMAAGALSGAALFPGVGAPPPAISVLSALEGLTLAAPALGPYVLPGAVAILIALFAVQSQGTARIGRAFGP